MTSACTSLFSSSSLSSSEGISSLKSSAPCHGSIFTVPQEYYNSIVKVGTAQSATKLIVDLNDPRRYNNGDLPVGYMKPTVNGEPEFGFFAMDGKTVHKVADFTLFYQRCLNWWNATDRKST